MGGEGEVWERGWGGGRCDLLLALNFAFRRKKFVMDTRQERAKEGQLCHSSLLLMEMRLSG